jgi:putative glutamine amidotransferase
MGLRKARSGLLGTGVGADCMLCHGGSILGKSYIGLGNSTLDIQGLFEDLARASGQSGLPVLGICRGMQVMAVAAGGDLVQHLPDILGNETHLPAPGVYGRHEVKIEPGTRLASVLGDRVEVAHYHHQGVGRHPGLNPTAYSHDGLLEAFEDPDAPFRLGVQWHPEQGEDPRLFEALVEAARERR